MKSYKISEAARILGVHPNTLRRWEREGRIKAFRAGRDRRFTEAELRRFMGEEMPEAVAIYARVSSRDQKEDLERQKMLLREKAIQDGFNNIVELTDIGSGLSGKRKGFRKLIELVKEKRIKKLYITHKERLVRFMFDFFKELFEGYGVEVIVLYESKSEPHRELIEDLIAILAHFAGKLYGLRSHKIKRLIKELRQDETESVR